MKELNDSKSPEKQRNRYILNAEEKVKRKTFVRKVTVITLFQTIATLCVTIPISFHQPVRDYLNQHTLIIYGSVLLMVFFTFFLIFCSWLIEVLYVNYVLLIILTSITAFWMTCLCVKYSHTLVGMAIVAAIILSLILGVYAMLTIHDFTLILGVLFVVTLIALILGVFFFVYPNPRLKWAILIGSTILTCVYYLSDVQMIISGDRTFYLETESHVLGACIMYVDFVYFFVYLLMILGDHTWTKDY